MLYGIDYSFGGGLTAAQVKAAGKSFVGRYLSNPGNSKNVSGTEAANYKAEGVAVIFFFETTGTDMINEANGVRDAQSAQQQLTSLALANSDTSLMSAPVFFAADEQTEVDETDYLKGTASVIGLHRNGLYGGLGSIKSAFDQGLITFGCQTYAWSGGQWDNRALLRQYKNGVQFGPAQVDLEQAAYWGVATPVLGPNDDYGQWPRPNVTATPPAPTPKPAPAPALQPKPAPTIPTYANGSRVLRYDPTKPMMHGTDVLAIQQFLKPSNIPADQWDDGWYGKNTAERVSWYEGFEGLTQETPYGVVGPQVWTHTGLAK